MVTNNENFEIYIENSAIGTKLSLARLTTRQASKGYNKWAVEDVFNGPSIPANIHENSKSGNYSDYIYGFYKEGMIVTLKLYSGRKNNVVKTIENVKILSK